jgi:hypothetical protein
MTITFRFGDPAEQSESGRSRLNKLYDNFFQSCSADQSSPQVSDNKQIAESCAGVFCRLDTGNAMCVALYVLFSCILLYHILRTSKSLLQKLFVLLYRLSITILILMMLAWRDARVYFASSNQRAPASNTTTATTSTTSSRSSSSSSSQPSHVSNELNERQTSDSANTSIKSQSSATQSLVEFGRKHF